MITVFKGQSRAKQSWDLHLRTSCYTIILRWSFAFSLENFLEFPCSLLLICRWCKIIPWDDSKFFRFLGCKTPCTVCCKWFFDFLSLLFTFCWFCFHTFFGNSFFLCCPFISLISIWFKFTSFTQAYEPRWIFSLLYFPPILVWSLLQLIFSQEFWLLVH